MVPMPRVDPTGMILCTIYGTIRSQRYAICRQRPTNRSLLSDACANRLLALIAARYHAMDYCGQSMPVRTASWKGASQTIMRVLFDEASIGPRAKQ